MKITEKHILFWGNWPSNFAWAPIKVTCVDGIDFVQETSDDKK